MQPVSMIPSKPPPYEDAQGLRSLDSGLLIRRDEHKRATMAKRRQVSDSGSSRITPRDPIGGCIDGEGISVVNDGTTYRTRKSWMSPVRKPRRMLRRHRDTRTQPRLVSFVGPESFEVDERSAGVSTAYDRGDVTRTFDVFEKYDAPRTKASCLT